MGGRVGAFVRSSRGLLRLCRHQVEQAANDSCPSSSRRRSNLIWPSPGRSATRASAGNTNSSISHAIVARCRVHRTDQRPQGALR